MAKDKKASKAAAPAPALSKPTEKVKAGRVTKPLEKAAVKAKETAKAVVGKHEEKRKKAKKEPTPEPSSEEEASTSESSASSDDESDSEVETKAPAKLNGIANGKAAKKDASDSESESDSDDASDEETAPKKAEAPKMNGNAKAAKADSSGDDSSSASDSDEGEEPKVNGKAVASSDDDSEASDSDSDSGSDEEIDAKASAKNVEADSEMEDDSDSDSSSDDDEEDEAKVKPREKAKADASDSSDASSSDDDDSEGDEDDEEEEKAKVEEKPAMKRKAEEAIDQTPKKMKATVNGEQKDAYPNLFCGNLSWNVDEEWLTREFEEFGELSGVRIITDRDSGRSKGYGYVEYVDVSSAVKAMEARAGTSIDGREIRLDFAMPRTSGSAQTPQQRSFDRAKAYGDTPKQPSKTIFVGNLSFNADENAVHEVFADFGDVKGVRLPTDRETGGPKGYGYVDFGSVEEAKAAFDGLQGTAIAGRPVRLDFASERSSNDSPRGGFGGRGGGRGRGGFGDRGGRGGGRGGFNDRGRGGRGGSTNRGGFGDFSGKKTTF